MGRGHGRTAAPGQGIPGQDSTDGTTRKGMTWVAGMITDPAVTGRRLPTGTNGTDSPAGVRLRIQTRTGAPSQVGGEVVAEGRAVSPPHE